MSASFTPYWINIFTDEGRPFAFEGAEYSEKTAISAINQQAHENKTNRVKYEYLHTLYVNYDKVSIIDLSKAAAIAECEYNLDGDDSEAECTCGEHDYYNADSGTGFRAGWYDR